MTKNIHLLTAQLKGRKYASPGISIAFGLTVHHEPSPLYTICLPSLLMGPVGLKGEDTTSCTLSCTFICNSV